MWLSLLAWLEGAPEQKDEEGKIVKPRRSPVLLGEMRHTHLMAFLDGNKLYKEHRRRYIRIVERAFDHLSKNLGYLGHNPGRKIAKEDTPSRKNDLSRFLTRSEREAVIAHIETGLEKIREAKTGIDEWCVARDAALIGAMIGAGLKVGQIQAVTVNCMKDERDYGGELFFDLPPRRGLAHAHRAHILPFAQPLLEAWHALQADPRTPGVRLFAARRDHGGVRPSLSNAPLHAASIFRRVRATLAECGITGRRACAQTLRNTYAALLIDAGTDNATLTDLLGLSDPLSAVRLRSSYTVWCAMHQIPVTPKEPAPHE
jgi:site-specific recombinase XerD